METITKQRYVGYVWMTLIVGIILSFTFGFLYSIYHNYLWLLYMGASNWLIGVGVGLAYGQSVKLK